ncbi:hypothetical protein DFQ04_1310 [Algoriphagus boseongensis]|uniref:Uncharacterized protein n=1 Tax=Algoriphagus boseongensis TaxID=1442587 RepID=A0A4R6T8B4_9BACT|nr:hypothetical protein [Algoriphagus boseongensis]TDQ19488.1 hypothetical protein DFQ04_1310 [Algoriphagus boseongensis]
MSFEEFKKLNHPESDFSPELLALWYDGKGDWKSAHDQVDHLESRTAARVHAYLHRKEGDSWNADYWYRRAGEKIPTISLDEEWKELVLRFLV